MPGVPQFDGSIRTPAGDGLSTGTEGDGVDSPDVPAKVGDGFAAIGTPDRDGSVEAASDEVLAVAGEGDTGTRSAVRARDAKRPPARGHIPHEHDAGTLGHCSVRGKKAGDAGEVLAVRAKRDPQYRLAVPFQ